MANPRGPFGLSDKRGNSAKRCARTPHGADCKGARHRTFARPPAQAALKLGNAWRAEPLRS
ncbi:hypothetical protein PUG81_13025 [Erwiniaceae bacterium L1_54_6]|nr:hypothetical protein [Erwiniaceae bacterium L1_54_6]